MHTVHERRILETLRCAAAEERRQLHASSSRARQRSPAGRHEGVRRRGASHQERDHRSLRHGRHDGEDAGKWGGKRLKGGQLT